MKARFFFLGIITLVLFYFKNAFTIGFFKDDLFFLNISQANSFLDFLNFFNPHKDFGHRPIPIELFYFAINKLNLSFFAIHIIIFTVYLVGLYFFYQSLLKISRQEIFSKITLLFYSLSFIHVFQLYAIWNFQEVCLFTFLSLSFYTLTVNKYPLSFLFYLLALLSKETAVFFPIFIFIVLIAKKILKLKANLSWKPSYLILITATAFIFGLLIKYEISKFAQNPLYAIHLSPRLIINNLMWLGLWSLGLPNYLPDYLTSIFSLPTPNFYKTLLNTQNRLYFYFILAYLISFFISTIYLLVKRPKVYRQLLWGLFLGGILFTLFNLPTLPTIHKTMIRLMVPLVFVSMFQGYVTSQLWQKKGFGRALASVLIFIYLFANYFGTVVHESASTFRLESNIYYKSKAYFDEHRNEVLKNDTVYIKDYRKKANPWGGSKKLHDTYWGQNFVQYLFPEKKITMVFAFQNPKIPKKAFVVSSSKLLPY